MTLIVPRYGGENISDVYGSVLSFFGIASKRKLKADVGKGNRLVLLVLDGLGTRTLEDSLPASALQGFERSNITSVFPSTTCVAMPGLYMGMTPAEHGVFGFTSFIKELGTIVNMFNLSHPSQDEQLPSLANDFESYIGNVFPPLGKKLQSSGVASRAIWPSLDLRWQWQGLPISGMEKVRYYSPWDALTALKDSLKGDSGPAFVTVYIPFVDTLSHHYGPGSQQTKEAVRGLFAMLSSCVGACKDFTLLVTADHGQANNRKTNFVDEELLSMLDMPPFGDSRAVFLKTRQEEKVGRYMEKRFPRFQLYTKREALDKMLFGSARMSQRFSERLGDLVAVPDCDESLLYPFLRTKSMDYYSYLGQHGGLTTEEQQVPLLMMRK